MATPKGPRVTSHQLLKRLDALERVAEVRGARFPDDGPAKRLRRMARAVVRMEFFGETYLPHYYRVPGARFHRALREAIRDHHRVAVEAPRGFAKSTAVTQTVALHQVVCGTVLRAWEEGTLQAQDPDLHAAIVKELAELDAERRAEWVETCAYLRHHAAGEIELPAEPPPATIWWDPYILIGSVTADTAVTEIAMMVKAECEENALIRSDWGELVDDPGVNYDDWVSRTGVRVRAFGFDQAIRGTKHGPYRPTLALIDDPDSKASVRTKRQRDETQGTLTGVVGYALEPKRARIFVMGTAVHPDCLVKRLLDPAKFGRWVRLRWQAIEDGKSIWEARWPFEELEAARAEDEEAFEMEMMGNAAAEGVRIFPVVHHYKRADWPDRGVVINILDPALGGENADYQAIVTLRWHQPKSKILVWRAELLRLPIPDLVERWLACYAEDQPDFAIAEAIGFQRLLAMMLTSRGNVQGLFPSIEQITRQSLPKDERIGSLAQLVREATILLPDDNSCRGGERQLLDFPSGKKDFPDALEMGVRKIRALAASRSLRHDIRHVTGRAADFMGDTDSRRGRPVRWSRHGGW